MPAIHFKQFLAEAVTQDREPGSGLKRDELYGLYTSWCLLHQLEPQSPEALWNALEAHGITPDDNGLSMTGPAAADYIVASAPDLI